MRELGLLPPLAFAGITIMIASVVLYLDVSRLWLVGAVFIAGTLLLAFFSTATAWRMFS